jgi:UDPglucose--hexose-1-phosphate uridylyltransferase
MKKSDMKNSSRKISELRKDLVSGSWVIIAPKRTQRPFNFKKVFPLFKRLKSSIKNCPFENPQLSGHEVPLLVLKDDKNKNQWAIQVVKNKYPALDGGTQKIKHEGPYEFRDGVGAHEIVILKDHYKNLYQLSEDQISQLVQAYVLRYQELSLLPYVSYISIFHNSGPSAGASIDHPHSQIMALPIIPPDVERSIRGSLNFYRKTNECVHCVMIDFEKKSKKRVIFENKKFIAFAPFASTQSFEVRIFPKKHSPQFEFMGAEDIKYFSEILSVVLRKISKALNDPDYNFFIHTAPVAALHYTHYHWHLEILPKSGIYAGLELSTNIIVVSTSPEDAAKILRNIKV